jgi:UDP-N-acetylglucosamine 2-epimerase
MVVVGTEKQNILKAMKEALERRKELPAKPLYGGGDAAEKGY